VLPDSRPGLEFDDAGVCSACRAHAAKRTEFDWSARRAELEALFAQVRVRRRGYDCIVPVSGGKDSTWQVVTCLERGLRVLAVTWRTPGRTVLGQANLENLVRLGVDHIDYSINPEVERRFMLRALRRTGSTAVPMHMAIYAIPLRLAVAMRVPLVVWGENPHVEYGRTDHSDSADRLDPDWGRRHGIQQGTTAADWIGDGLTEKDLEPYFPPPREEFEAAGVQSVFLGLYLPWDPQESLRVARRHGFRVRAEGPRCGLYDYADIDCQFISVHHHFKWLKFGFTRLFDNLALEIRNGRMTRAQALQVIRERGDQTPHEDIDALCRFLRISRHEFAEIEESFRNRRIWQRDRAVWRIPGFLIPDWSWT
jgi:N-acetyl sugar amidotransferase